MLFRSVSQSRYTSGNLLVHLDWRVVHHVRIRLDSILGDAGEFQNEIIWKYNSGGASKARLARKHDTILWYTKSGDILNFENVHIDHYDMTFNDMFNIWISNYNEDYLYSKIKKDNKIGVKFIDSKIVEDFKKFHNENTKLRMVSTFANLSILKKM